MPFEPPMVIDMHAHLHEPGTSKWAAQQGIDRTVLMSGPNQNDEVLSYCAASEGRFIPFCRVRLDDIPRACDRLREYAARGARGFKFQPMVERFLPHEERMYPVWETIQALGLPLTSHAGSVKYEGHCVNYADPSGWSQVAWDFPRLKIVIAHLGGDRGFEALTVCEACPNVYMDTAHLHYWCSRMLPRVTPFELVERAVGACGREKILFASEGMTPGFLYEGVGLDREALKFVFWKNALRLLGEADA